MMLFQNSEAAWPTQAWWPEFFTPITSQMSFQPTRVWSVRGFGVQVRPPLTDIVCERVCCCGDFGTMYKRTVTETNATALAPRTSNHTNQCTLATLNPAQQQRRRDRKEKGEERERERERSAAQTHSYASEHATVEGSTQRLNPLLSEVFFYPRSF